MRMTLTSPAFSEGKPLPLEYTCDGEDISPPLAWGALPPKTRSIALIVDDPDAPMGTWDHWIVYNLPPSLNGLAENAASALPHGALHGRNSWKNLGWGGPCPPNGMHRYIFKLFALDTVLDLAAGASKKELLFAMDTHVLGQAQLMGVYARRL